MKTKICKKDAKGAFSLTPAQVFSLIPQAFMEHEKRAIALALAIFADAKASDWWPSRIPLHLGNAGSQYRQLGRQYAAENMAWARAIDRFAAAVEERADADQRVEAIYNLLSRHDGHHGGTIGILLGGKHGESMSITGHDDVALFLRAVTSVVKEDAASVLVAKGAKKPAGKSRKR